MLVARESAIVFLHPQPNIEGESGWHNSSHSVTPTAIGLGIVILQLLSKGLHGGPQAVYSRNEL